MLVKSMSNPEVHLEIIQDYNLINASSTISRLNKEYLSLRKKLKINKHTDFPFFSTIKTKAKNTWYLMFLKNPEIKAVASEDDVVIIFYTFYYTDKGLRVFNATPSGALNVYNGHFFTRYRERMELPIVATLDLIQHFFKNNHGGFHSLFKKEEQSDVVNFIGFEKEGYSLGNYEILNEDTIWLVHKTFIGKNTAGSIHLKQDKQLIYTVAKILLTSQNDNQKTLDARISVLAHELGLMKENKITADLETLMAEIPKEILEDLNEGIMILE